jgi:hypothetical protein
MFPDKIGRLVVDGVMDVEDYFTGMWSVCLLTYQTLTNPVDRWSDEMRDSDLALNLFYESCVEAGPEACTLHDADAAKIHFRMEKVFKALKERPIAVPPQGNTTSLQSDYGVVDYGMVRVFVFFFLYAPYAGRTTSAASLAAALAAVEKRDGRPFWDLVKGMRATVQCNCGDGKPQDQRLHEPNMAISCSDKAFSNDSMEYLQARYERAAKVSSFAGLRGLFCSYAPEVVVGLTCADEDCAGDGRSSRKRSSAGRSSATRRSRSCSSGTRLTLSRPCPSTCLSPFHAKARV